MKREMIAGLAALLIGLATPPLAAAQRDGAVLRNSGSTNFPGYTIKVWSDGSAWTSRSATQSIPVVLTQRFLHDAQAARDNHATGRHCMKSASFGTTAVVLWHGWTSPDIECPGDGYVSALATDARSIVAALHLTPAVGRRIPMLPNEPRRLPSDSAPMQARPTPEPATDAS